MSDPDCLHCTDASIIYGNDCTTANVNTHNGQTIGITEVAVESLLCLVACNTEQAEQYLKISMWSDFFILLVLRCLTVLFSCLSLHSRNYTTNDRWNPMYFSLAGVSTNLNVSLKLATNNRKYKRKTNHWASLPWRKTIYTLVHTINDRSIPTPSEFEPSCTICWFTVEISRAVVGFVWFLEKNFKTNA